MKKIISAIMLAILIMIPNKVYGEEKEVTIYMFRGETCGHCEQALNDMNENRKMFGDNIKIVTYEVWNDEDNAKLQKKISEKLKVKKDYVGSVPFIVIGDKYYVGYGGKEDLEKFAKVASNYLTNGKYKDVVKKEIKKSDIDVTATTLDDIYGKPNATLNAIIYVVFGLIVLGIAVMIIFSRK